jgi:hypothetical protein
MKLAIFLAAATVIMLSVMAGLGAWLLPRLGVEGSARSIISGAASGVLIVMLYSQMFRATGS